MVAGHCGYHASIDCYSRWACGPVEAGCTVPEEVGVAAAAAAAAAEEVVDCRIVVVAGHSGIHIVGAVGCLSSHCMKAVARGRVVRSHILVVVEEVHSRAVAVEHHNLAEGEERRSFAEEEGRRNSAGRRCIAGLDNKT